MTADGWCVRKSFKTREALERHIERTVARSGESRTARRFCFEVYVTAGGDEQHPGRHRHGERAADHFADRHSNCPSWKKRKIPPAGMPVRGNGKAWAQDTNRPGPETRMRGCHD